ncbi:serine/arginine repetitive matrix protein 2 [Streptomyces qinglanensis]|uniref:serine/arginine repetitive matrix protein 2 n=1 Tax=Streptomyces qinglanensis TaxID=943816 RepID=UPI001EF97EC0|nr:serine/arginine repetitive matrix protein 2 [Streptomyces qinglanensis]
MAIGNPGGAAYGGPPPRNVPAKELRPRRLWYVVAAVLALVLAGSGTAVIVSAVRDTVDSIDTDHTFPSGGSRTFRFTAGETKAIYASVSGRGRVNCRIPQMQSGSMKQPDSTFRITSGSRTWERVFEVKPGSSGDYTLTCTSDRQTEFALGDEPRVGTAVGSVLAAIALFLAAVASAVTISVVTAVRRGRHRRRLTMPGPQPYPGHPGPPPFGSPPFGPPPGASPPGPRS